MSRKPVPTTTNPDAHNAAPAAMIPDDVCPVCRRQKYFNPDLEFLINPECYHPMCQRCVEHIFGKGPAQCPHPGCIKTLRQRGFHSAFFKDLKVEREVDVRRRVQAVFNMTEDDFVSIRDYNDYLQQVEDLTFDLVQGGDADRKAAEKKLLAYEQKHREDIEKNKRRGREAETIRKQRSAADAEAARQRRLEEQREEERARAEEASINAEVMEALARGEPGSAAEIQARIVAQKRARVAEIAGSHFSSLINTSSNPTKPRPGSNLLSIRGLKDKNARDEDAEYYLRPYDPFAGLDLQPSRYKLRNAGAASEYANPWLDRARSADDHKVPGYSTQEYVARAMFEAFAGLGVVVGEEKADAARAVGTSGAEVAAKTGRTGGMDVDKGVGRMDVDDVFV
ncbi:CDK-activating kinase assembly factor MAT1-domain-containing protein [Annulohypoxylon maeteangense]|uniref:CDK-activating kinase assembly factor MAT1-domain-containing protein n=1 Tax=Annulohypoxylon maeteangense TaxID=1927788 RepID=UPI0020081ED1|nr:CDK-activating kinase assembly factor MAT1-domain-containing protein [Annulohypoxylon maeteangense]KAI0881585.1 CDK-activating kinase assembly factor MAT1-domain-containing protein [Annulohypoxylon maeteangense]